jgi:quinolinate synthase
MSFKTYDTYYQPNQTKMPVYHDMSVCQSDYPLDWYQEEYIPYAEAYLALPDRTLGTIIQWMTPYIQKAQDHFGDSLLLLAHYYMGGNIVRIIENFGGCIGDSYQLAKIALNMPEKSVIVESAVHFMAESIALLAHPHQTVWITNPKSGCTMEMMAKDFMVEPAFMELNARYGKDNILPVCYMNTSGRIKAMTGAQGGAVCTSSNVTKIVQWAQKQGKKILFIPDRHMGENVAHWLGIQNLAYWPGGSAGAQYSLSQADLKTLDTFDRADMILFDSHCAVHTYYQPSMSSYWKDLGYTTIVHPECRNTVVQAADFYGSTAFIWDHVTQDKSKTKRYAIGTENHMVDNLKAVCQPIGIEVVNMADMMEQDVSSDSTIQASRGCGCATMSRNDPPHLVAILDLLRQGSPLPYNQVRPGDVIDPFSGSRQRLNVADQNTLTQDARIALENMIRIVESVSDK